ncbi:MAG: CPBP family intramembrane metalloprotease [Proteobacteria bacterium]|nr:CPBP family intramembrane metalloprotease [Pseudomonadota bacterium]
MAIAESATGIRSTRAPLLTFLILAFPLSWYPWAVALIQHRSSGPNPLGVLLAAIIASAVFGRWRGLRDLLLSLVRVRAPLHVWAVAILTPVATVALGCLLAMEQGAVFQVQPVPWSDLLDRFVFTFLFVALGEEPGWRGYLLPRLQERFHPLLATFVLIPIWAIWHLPLMGTEFTWPLVPAFLASLAGGAIVLSWLYNASKGSVLLPMIMHALLNTVGAGYAFKLAAPEALPHLWWIYAGVWAAAGGVVVLCTKGRLGKSRAEKAAF